MSASPGAHIRGYTATCIVIDESQDVIDAKYAADIMPFGSTTNALILEAGTPQTKNHFYDTINNKSGKIKVVRQPWFECPFLSEEYVMSQKAINPDALWRQEYLCEFVEEGVLVFPSRLFEPEMKNGKMTGRWNLAEYSYIKKADELTKERMIMINDLIKNEKATYTAGLDLGKQNDQTVFTVFRTDCRPIKLAVKIEFPLDTNYKDIAAWIAVFYKVYQPTELNIDYTNEKAFIEMLQENNVPVVKTPDMTRGAIQFTSKNKAEMINTTKILLENYQLCLPKDAEVLISQFLNQQFEMSENKKIRYFHPSNEHDDALWSSLLALKNITLLSYEDIIMWSNPWETFDQQVHGQHNRPSPKEALATNSHYARDRRRYKTAEQRRSASRF
jgi:phage FluMu gp28-like protein